MLTAHSRVLLKNPIPRLGLEAGAEGVVVNVYADGAAYEVEFLGVDGRTIGVETIDAVDVLEYGLAPQPQKKN